MSDTCEKCNTSLKSTEKFCSSCGTERKFDQAASSNVHIKSENNSELIIEWNESTSQFIAGTGSSLQFKVSPRAHKTCSDITFYFRFPDSNQIEEKRLEFARLTSSQVININYRPAESAIGTRRIIDMFVSYSIAGDVYWFVHQLPIDIFSGNQGGAKLIENFSIRIDSIVQEGKAGDPKMSILDSLKTDDVDSINDALKGIRSSDAVWTVLPFVESKPVDVTGVAAKQNVKEPVIMSAQTNESGNATSSVNKKETPKVDPVAPQAVPSPSTAGGKQSSYGIYIVMIAGFLVVGGALYYLLGNNLLKMRPSNSKTVSSSSGDNDKSSSSSSGIHINQTETKSVSIDIDSLAQGLDELQIGTGSSSIENSSTSPIIVNLKTKQQSSSSLPVFNQKVDKNSDTDRDGLLDHIEEHFGLDPRNPLDALHDNDNDGFTNLSEILGVYNKQRTVRTTDIYDPESHHDFALRLSFVKNIEPRHLFTVLKVDEKRVLVEYLSQGVWKRDVLGLGDQFRAGEIPFTLNHFIPVVKKVFDSSLWKDVELTSYMVNISGAGTNKSYKENDQNIEQFQTTALVKDDVTGKEYSAVSKGSLVLGTEETGLTTYAVASVRNGQVRLQNTKTNKIFTIENKGLQLKIDKNFKSLKKH